LPDSIEHSFLQRQQIGRQAAHLFIQQVWSSENMSTQYQGTLKFMHPKGYGFIASDNGEDHFVHRNDLERGSQINCDLLENGVTRFRYELEQDSRNNELKAVRLSVI
jgi:cold shock CspA family protein